MVPIHPKRPSDMTHGELISSLVAFAAICGVINAFNIMALVRYGFSLWAIIGLVVTSAILVGALIQFGGELRRRKQGGQP